MRRPLGAAKRAGDTGRTTEACDRKVISGLSLRRLSHCPPRERLLTVSSGFFTEMARADKNRQLHSDWLLLLPGITGFYQKFL